MKPDPPLNVTVEALEKAPQQLRVNWSYPSSWDPRFYWLRFQVRYRPEPAETFTEVRYTYASPQCGAVPQPQRGFPHPRAARAPSRWNR